MTGRAQADAEQPRRIVIFGNASSGKSTLARKLGAALDLDVLELDEVRWLRRPDTPRPPADCERVVRAFVEQRDGWIVEGLHASLLAIALERATEAHFLNPPFEVCLERARSRPWDPRKSASPEEQRRLIEKLEPWFRSYDTRSDETSLSAHRALFEGFGGAKWEHTGADAEVGPAGGSS